MATHAFPFGPGQATDNLTGLGPGQAKVLGAVGDGTLIYDIVVAPIIFLTGAGAVGSVDLFLAMSETGGAPPSGIWSAGIDPTLATDQSSKLLTGQIRQVSSLSVTGAQSYQFDEFSCSGFLGFFAMYYCLVIRNNSGIAFNATASNFNCQYSRQNFGTPAPLVYA